LSAITTLQLLGLAGLLSYGAARLVAKTGLIGYSRYTLVAVPVTGMPKMPRGYRVENMSFDQLGDLPINVRKEEQERWFVQGMKCLVAFNSKDECVGANWVGPGPFDEIMVHLRFAVPEAAAWDTGLWIPPEHRLGRGFSALWAGTADWLHAHGRQWSMSWIADYNLPSLLSHKRMQSQVVGHIMIFRLGRWQFMAQGRPRLVRIDRGARPLMQLSLPA
jgi:hypothetical protein